MAGQVPQPHATETALGTIKYFTITVCILTGTGTQKHLQTFFLIYLSIYLLSTPEDMLIDFREWGREGEREGEKQ